MWKELGYVTLVTVLLFLVALILCGATEVAGEPVLYVVQPGDSLYSIAESFAVCDWRKWCYEVCEANGLKNGGEIFPGDEIVIEVKRAEGK